MPRKAVLRKAHTLLNPKLKGRKKEFVKRAMGMGIRSIGQLSEVTGLPKERIKEIEDGFKFSHRARGNPLPQNAIERLLINGELSNKEISKLTGTTPGGIDDARLALRARGIETNIKRSNYPPIRAAKAIIAFKAIKELEGLSNFMILVKNPEIQGVPVSTVITWVSPRSDYARKIKELAGGKYWQKALKQMQPWLKERKKEFQN